MTVTNQPTSPGQTTTLTGNDTVAGNDTIAGNDTVAGSILTDPPPELFDPEKFEFPTDLNKEHETFKQFVDYAKEMGLTKVNAEKLVGIHAAAVKSTSEAIFKQWTDQQAAWAEEIKKDTEIGNTTQVRQTFAAIADNPTLSDPKFKEALDFTGAGNHPAIVRTLYRWAKALSEGASIAGDPAKRDAQGQVTAAPVNAAAAMYGPSGPHSGGPKLS